MNLADLREAMGLTVAQVADELNVPRQDIVDCEETGETYLFSRFVSVFPINPAILRDPEADPFLASFDQTCPGYRMRQWREENGVTLAEMADALGESEESLAAFEDSEETSMARSRGELIEKRTGMNRKWLMYGDGRDKGQPKMKGHNDHAQSCGGQAGGEEKQTRRGRSAVPVAPNKEAGMRIREARKAAGMSREELADRVKLSVSRIAQMESGYVKEDRAQDILSKIPVQNTEEDRKAPGLRLRTFRKEAGLSVKQAAAIIGIQPTSLAHMESGYVTDHRADEMIAQMAAAGQGTKKVFSAKEAGNRIRDARKEKGLSQKELATILRVTPLVISSMEYGDVTEERAEEVIRRINGAPRREPTGGRKRVKRTDQVLLGSRIRDARIAAGMSQKEVADLIGMSQGRVSLMEKGKVDESVAEEILRRITEKKEGGGENRENPPEQV